MDERVVQFRVGVMLLATLIITGILVMLFGEMPTLIRQNYSLQMRFEEAPGITTNTPVLKSGLLIGRVTSVRLDDETSGVWVEAMMDSNVKLRDYEVPRIMRTLLGDSSIEFVPNRLASSEAQDVILGDGDKLEGEVAPAPIQAINDLQERMAEAFESFNDATAAVKSTSLSIQATSDSIKATSDAFRVTSSQFGETSVEWKTLGAELNKTITGPENRLERLLRKTEGMVENIDAASTDIRTLVTDPDLRKNLAVTLENMPKTLDEARATIQMFQASIQLIDKNLTNLEGFTQPLGEQGKALIGKLASSAEKIEEVFAQVAVLTGNLNSNKGTVGQLINNPDLYQNVNAAVLQLNQLLNDAKPILKDARIFADKIARHPEVLGVRGAINRSSGIK